MPVAVAVLLIDPASTSDWVMLRVAVHVVEAPGANVVDGHDTLDNPANGSVMLTAVRVTLPVFVTANENVCTSPGDGPVGAESLVRATDLASAIVFVWAIAVDVDDVAEVTAGPEGGVALAVAVLVTTPAFTSA